MNNHDVRKLRKQADLNYEQLKEEIEEQGEALKKKDYAMYNFLRKNHAINSIFRLETEILGLLMILCSNTNGHTIQDSDDGNVSLARLLPMFNDSQEIKLIFSENNSLCVTPGFLKGMDVDRLLDCKVSHIESTDDCIDIFLRGEQHVD